MDLTCVDPVSFFNENSAQKKHKKQNTHPNPLKFEKLMIEQELKKFIPEA